MGRLERVEPNPIDDQLVFDVNGEEIRLPISKLTDGVVAVAPAEAEIGLP